MPNTYMRRVRMTNDSEYEKDETSSAYDGKDRDEDKSTYASNSNNTGNSNAEDLKGADTPTKQNVGESILNNFNAFNPFETTGNNIHESKKRYFGSNSIDNAKAEEDRVMNESLNNYFEEFNEASGHLYNMSAYEDNDKYISSSIYDQIGDIDSMGDYIYESVRDVVKNAKHKFDKKTDAIDRGVADRIKKMNDDIKDDIRDKYVERIPFKLSKVIKTAIGVGALWAINPAIAAVGAVVTFARKKTVNARERDRLISEIREERAIVEEKIKDADSSGDKNKKYQLMRLKISLDRAEKRLMTY